MPKSPKINPIIAAKLGATGKFPDGKLTPNDEGELQLGLASDSAGRVHFNFGKPIAWFAMERGQAIDLARLILRHAGVKKVEIEL